MEDVLSAIFSNTKSRQAMPSFLAASRDLSTLVKDRRAYAELAFHANDSYCNLRSYYCSVVTTSILVFRNISLFFGP